jgi:UDP-2-acetamido-2-deoxy-ribo-hexuluronate aminotransferase
MSPVSLRSAIEKVLQDGALKPRGIVAVDLFGQPADYDAIEQIAREYDLFLLEDAAQGFGCEYKGKKSCSFGDVAATSFFPAKPLGCFGDGGAIFTDDDELAALMTSFRVHGQGVDKYDNVRMGLNGRLDTIQAAVVLAKLEIFDDEIVARNRVAALYTEQLSDILVTPTVPEGSTSVWAQYSVLAADTEAA